MNTRIYLVVENSIKHSLTILIAFLLWEWIEKTVGKADEVALGSIGTILGLLVIASLSAYFAFSFTAVGKEFRWRLVGYITTFLLFLPFVLSGEVILTLAIRLVPQLEPLWWFIVSSLFVGAVAYDYLDLMRIGLDITSLDFFERTVATRSDELDFLIGEIRRGRDLADANAIIGRALACLGKRLKNRKLLAGGFSIISRSSAEQKVVDYEVVTLLEPFAEDDAELQQWLAQLKADSSQALADSLIADSIERVAQIAIKIK